MYQVKTVLLSRGYRYKNDCDSSKNYFFHTLFCNLKVTALGRIRNPVKQ
jgi:hypothetical protein